MGMKAFLLAAGLGTRLRPLTNCVPKCMVPVQGRPLLDIWLDLCAQHGITEVLVNIHWHAEIVRTHLANRKNPVHVILSEEPVLLGSGGTIRSNRHWLRNDPFFWILYADVLTNLNLRKMLEVHLSSPAAATLGVSRVANPSECGIVLVDQDGFVRSFLEKPALPPSNLAFSGIVVATNELVQQIPDQFPCDLGRHVLPLLVDRMRAYHIPDYLLDVGSMEKYDLAQLTWPGLQMAAEANLA
jgi:mannose-1-phosphate guanylyltransferase